MNGSVKKRKKTIFISLGFLAFFIVGMCAVWLLSKDTAQEYQGGTTEDSPLTKSTSTPEADIDDTVAVTDTEDERLMYIIIKDSCGIHFENECVRVHSGPGLEYPVVAKLRNNVLLRVSTTTTEGDGHTWYKILFDETLKYPERVVGEWYVASEYADVLLDQGTMTTETHESASTTQHIVVDISEQKLYAYDGDALFMEAPVSTGLLLSPTPRGMFTVFRKMPSRYMQGPLPGHTDYYDLPGVPWNLYFTQEGAVIHGAYWHDSFGKRYSHGCVNLLPENAHKLYDWATLGTKIVVRD